MGNKGVRSGTYALMSAVVAAGCSVGPGSPDGWRYVRVGEVAVAHPKSWRETATGAVLRDARGRTDAVLTVRPAGSVGGSPAKGPQRWEAAGSVPPADSRKDTLTLDGHRARVFNYARPAPDGRPAAYVEVQVPGRAARPLLIRAWTADGTARDPAVLPEIVNSIEFPAPGERP
jgi:hypothetical protein